MGIPYKIGDEKFYKGFPFKKIIFKETKKGRKEGRKERRKARKKERK